MVSLLRQIVEHNPPIEVLHMGDFSFSQDKNEDIGELVLETLLNSNIDTITDLNFKNNFSWFEHPETREERSNNVDLIA